jgi:Zn-dependent protease with chaperone function
MIPNLETIGRWIVILGLAITLIGGGIWLIARITGWEKFPGTIKWQSGNFTCLVPLLGSIILSVVLTLVLNLLVRWFNR